MKRNPPRFPSSPAELPPNVSKVLALSPSFMTLGLGNMTALLEALDHPERAFRSVVVAGTNGKGSVTAYLSAILTSGGVRTGWFSSPHVYDVSERIQIDNVPVGIVAMEEAAARVVPLREQIRYSYFEALTAMAFLVFAEQNVDVAVLETGLGGRFDATNVVDPVACVLTNIGLDHRRVLGDTKEEILREKLGIVRRGVPLIGGPLEPQLDAIVRDKCAHDGVEYVAFGDAAVAEDAGMSFEGMSARVRTPFADYGTVPLPFIGEHQLANALLAIATAERVAGPPRDLARAAELAYIPGRFEVHDVAGKRIVLDVAHNDDGLIAACGTILALSPRECNALVLGMLKRKEIIRFPSELPRFVSRVHLVEPGTEEACKTEELSDRLGADQLTRSGVEVVREQPLLNDADWERLLDSLLSPKHPASVILVAGSHHTVETIGRRMSHDRLAGRV